MGEFSFSPSFFLEIFLEGLPISSSGHIYLLSHLFPHVFTPLNLIENHLTHALFILILINTVSRAIANLFRISFFTLLRTGINFFIISITTVLCYLIFEGLLQNINIKMPLYQGFLITTFFLIMIKYFNRGKGKKYYLTTMSENIFLGLFQTVAFLPGVSRFATMIVGSLLCGYNKNDALHIAIISNACISSGSIIYLLYKYKDYPFFFSISYPEFFVLIITLLLGLFFFLVFSHFFKRNKISIFIYYEFFISLITFFFFKNI
jgi:undecaprenyl-diphosphatase